MDPTFILAALGTKSMAMKLLYLEMGLVLAQQQRAHENRRRMFAFRRAVLKHAPILCGGEGKPRGGKFYGRRTDYARDHFPPMQDQEFYEHFRFERQDIDRLCRALNIPSEFVTTSRCRIDGEEALLIFLKVLSYIYIQSKIPRR